MKKAKSSQKASCKKVAYRSKVDALIVLAKVQAIDNPRREKIEQRAYKCPGKPHWHLTSIKRGS